MGTVAFSPRALEDRATIFGLIGWDNIDAAVDVDLAIEESCELVSDNPGVGPLCGFRKMGFENSRFWPVKKYKHYLILYRPTAEGIEVLRVIHGKRDFRRFESRLT
jgi:toxin ParE1/3/4